MSALNSSSTKLLRRYEQKASAPRFLSQFFKSPPENWHRTETVAIDIVREEEEIAIPIQDLSVSGRQNEATIYTTKEIKPPIYDEVGSVTAWNAMQRRPGASPFDEPDYRLNALDEAYDIAHRLERKIRRSVELMSSQVLQTGMLDLRDKDGNTLYVLNFLPRSSHFPTVSVDWGSGGDDIYGDLASLMAEIRMNGGETITDLVFGTNAFRHFQFDDDIQRILDNRRIEGSKLEGRVDGKGVRQVGFFQIEGTTVRLWIYDGMYVDPVTRTKRPYVDPDKVIMLSEGGRLDLSYGAVPILVPPEQRALPFLPPTIANADLGIYLTTHSWVEPNGKSVSVNISTRPITIPTAIDTYGCLTTKA